MALPVEHIASLPTAIEMRREVLRRAIELGKTEDEVWEEVNYYRHRASVRLIGPEKIDQIIVKLIGRYDPSKLPENYSPAEQYFAYIQQTEGIKFKQQYKIGKYRVDFFYPEKDLIVEIDGKSFHTSPSQIEYDEKRHRWLMNKGYVILRFSAREIYYNCNECIDKVKKFLGMEKEEAKKKSLPPSGISIGDWQTLREAKIDLEKVSNENRILYWLRKLPERLHIHIKVHLDRVYPDGHSFDKAKIKWMEEKITNVQKGREKRI